MRRLDGGARVGTPRAASRRIEARHGCGCDISTAISSGHGSSTSCVTIRTSPMPAALNCYRGPVGELTVAFGAGGMRQPGQFAWVSRRRARSGSARNRFSSASCSRADDRVKPKGMSRGASGSSHAATHQRNRDRCRAALRIGAWRPTGFQRLEDFARGVLPGRPREAAAGMRARAAEKEPLDRRAVLRPAEHRPHREELIERQLAVMDVAAGQAVGCLEIDRREDLAMLDERSQSRRVALERAQHGGRERSALGVPVDIPARACRARTARRPT